MAGHQRFIELVRAFSPERRVRVAATAAALEARDDMHVGHLRRHIEALGGALEITARFPEASVVISSVGVTARSPR